MTLLVETLKSVPRGKAVWNANGGFVSVLLTHLFMFNSVFNFNFLAVVVSEIIWGPKLTSGRHAPLAENFYTKCEYFTISSVFLNFRFLSLVVSELLGGS